MSARSGGRWQTGSRHRGRRLRWRAGGVAEMWNCRPAAVPVVGGAWRSGRRAAADDGECRQAGQRQRWTDTSLEFWTVAAW